MNILSVEEIKKAITLAEVNQENLYVLLPKRVTGSFVKLILDAKTVESSIELQTVNGWLAIDINEVSFFVQ